MFLSTGIVPDASVNSDDAIDIGRSAASEMGGQKTSRYTEMTKWGLLEKSVRPSKSGVKMQ